MSNRGKITISGDCDGVFSPVPLPVKLDSYDYT